MFLCRKIFPGKKLCFLCRKIFDKKNIGSRSRSRSQILKVSVPERVVLVSNGQVSVSDDEAETPSLIPNKTTNDHLLGRY